MDDSEDESDDLDLPSIDANQEIYVEDALEDAGTSDRRMPMYQLINDRIVLQNEIHHSGTVMP